MPDVKPCDYPPAGPAPSSSDVMDLMEPCMADLVSQNPLCSSFPHSSQQQLGPAYHHAHHHHPSLHHNHHQGGGAAFPLMSRCNSSSTLLTNLGLRYGPPQGAPRGQQQGQGPPSCGPPGWQGDSGDPAGGCGGGGGGRPYRSMENLNWSNVQGGAEPPGGLYGGALPYRSVDSEFIFRCSATTTSHWCDGGGGMAPPLDHHGCSNNKAAGGGGYYAGLIGPNPESLAFYPRRCLGPRADLPTLFPQWLFPSGGGGAVDESWEARKGLRDKLRLQSARSASEPLKPHPLRPQAAVTVVTPGIVQVPPCDRGGGPPPPPPHASLLLLPPAALGAGPVHHHQRAPCVRRITSPEDIKQEVLRRLQLRRQNSSPNLSALHHHGSSPEEQRPPEGLLLIKTSYTTDNIAGGKRDRPQEDSAAAAGPEGPEPRRPPAAAGRLHIPTFEEFKRMRQTADEVVASEKKADAPSLSPRSTSAQREDDGEEEEVAPSGRTDARCASDGERGERGGEGTSSSSSSSSSSNTTSVATTCTLLSPIRTGPAPRSPLQTSEQSPAPVVGVGAELEVELEEEEGCVVEPSRRRSSLEPAGSSSSVPLLPNHHHHRTNSDHSRVSWERPSSCCPALLLEGSELSRYGAKIYKMKDGLIGSALDLIKKSCSAESPASVGETPVRVSGDQEGGGGGSACDVTAPLPTTTDCQSSAVSMATAVAAACGADEEEESEETEEPAECQHPGLGCRRSSSDAAYELARTSRTQRECRLRPHYSDPMPADAAKRKQLEMKIAAAARLHSQRRDRERDRDRDSAPAAVRGRSEPRGEERQGGGVGGAARSGAGQHRWSTVSSLSADSGVVGLSDEREDQEDCSSSEPRRHHTHHHHHQHHHQHHRRSRGSGADVERADSGIGPGLARGWKRPSASLRAWEAQRPCPDCGQRDLGGGGGASRELRNSEAMCERCSKLRTERKEAILEFLNTETSYGEDLRIIREEFYSPMQSAGLLTSEHLATVFGNVQELIEVNERFTEHLQDSIDQAFDQGDEDLLTVYIGEIFLEFVNMLPAFQTYCLQQSTSVNMLNSLEKEKELLRIFLDVSQNDNTALRRMNLRSFLMAPLQRVTKYPLLLSRISKATTDSHPDHGRLREAKSRVESHLEHINMKTKQEGGGGTGTGGVTWSLRSFRRDSRKNREVINIEMREVSMKTVGWARENTRFVMEGPLQLSQPADGQWVKKGSRALKFQNVQSLLMVRTQRGTTGTGVGESQGGPTELGGSVNRGVDQGGDRGGGGETVWDGVLVLIKDKSSGKFAVLREPIRLGNCVVSAEPDCEDTFELLDIRRESFVFRATDKSRTQQWFRQIKRYARDLGPWRRRRNALPNIMINTNQTRS